VKRLYHSEVLRKDVKSQFGGADRYFANMLFGPVNPLIRRKHDDVPALPINIPHEACVLGNKTSADNRRKNANIRMMALVDKKGVVTSTDVCDAKLYVSIVGALVVLKRMECDGLLVRVGTDEDGRILFARKPK